MTDQEIIRLVRQGKREKPLRHLYKEFPKIKSLILSSGCTSTLAQEIFNDSLLLLIEKIEDPQFELTSKLTTYLYGINRFLVKNELRKQQRSIELEWSDTIILSATDLGYNEQEEERFLILEKILGSLSEKCRHIFELFYFRKLSMEEIAGQMQYASVNSAKTQKYKCMEQAYELSEKFNAEL